MSEHKIKPKVEGYRDLVVWQKGIVLAKMGYALTERLPAGEKFGLVSQIRPAVVSIPSNIAEGQARHTTGDFIRFVAMAEGSVAELDTPLTLCIERGFFSADQLSSCFDLLGQIRRMLNGLRRKLAALN